MALESSTDVAGIDGFPDDPASSVPERVRQAYRLPSDETDDQQ